MPHISIDSPGHPTARGVSRFVEQQELELERLDQLIESNKELLRRLDDAEERERRRAEAEKRRRRMHVGIEIAMLLTTIAAVVVAVLTLRATP
jgi:hypothetical protein